jgi:hypothetical protein
MTVVEVEHFAFREHNQPFARGEQLDRLSQRAVIAPFAIDAERAHAPEAASHRSPMGFEDLPRRHE